MFHHQFHTLFHTTVHDNIFLRLPANVFTEYSRQTKNEEKATRHAFLWNFKRNCHSALCCFLNLLIIKIISSDVE
ncbi:hypothetical protein JTE90_002105 [Oedothorax gibbosus]|uniref:Uncharacterized protein n=1 Tax=Oedothorax gibbosus TaxID=931172 RepID=A0AAV6V6C7_9ARAC|nr:hypothetical protein JTE90_002105 [Oedothorax gibbosus]